MSSMASAETPEAVLHRFASLLEAAGVPYMLTGSFASGFHGAPRATQDIDIVIAPDLGSLNRFLSALDDEKVYVSREAARDAFGRETLFNVIDYASGWKIDFICRKSRPYSHEEFARRIQSRLAEHSVFIASAEDVILSKLEWAKISASERQLEDVAGIVRIQAENLDRIYLARWVDELALEKEWLAVQNRLG